MGIWEIICIFFYVLTGDLKDAFICWIGGYILLIIAVLFLAAI